MFVTLEPQFGHLLQELLDGEGQHLQAERLEQLLSLAQHCRSSQQQQSLAEPVDSQAVLAMEQFEVEQCFDNLLACLRALHQASTDRISLQTERALSDLVDSADRLSLALLRWREVALSERGPTTHAGLNELFQLLGQNQSPLPPALELVLEREIARLHTLTDVLDHFNLDLEDFQQNYRQFLSDLPFAEWEASLFTLGESYRRLDLSFLIRHYSAGPTPIAWLNLAHQSCQLWALEAISDTLAATLVERALAQLETLGQENPSHVEFSQLVTRLQLALSQLAQALEDGQPETIAAQLATLEKLGFQLADLE